MGGRAGGASMIPMIPLGIPLAVPKDPMGGWAMRGLKDTSNIGDIE
jgi:hypothetical protein